MYNNPYNYNPQISLDRINTQIAELEKLKSQIPIQPPAINQTFQLANNANGIRYANNIDEVNKENVITETPFFSKDLSVLWLKNPKGEVRSFELYEIIKKDDKDILISSLQMQIEELRKEIKGNAKSVVINVDEPSEDEKSSNVSIPRTSKKK